MLKLNEFLSVHENSAGCNKMISTVVSVCFLFVFPFIFTVLQPGNSGSARFIISFLFCSFAVDTKLNFWLKTALLMT